MPNIKSKVYVYNKKVLQTHRATEPLQSTTEPQKTCNYLVKVYSSMNG